VQALLWAMVLTVSSRRISIASASMSGSFSPESTKLGTLNAEHIRQGDHLGYRRIRNGTVPDSLHFFLCQIPQAHAGDVSARTCAERL
jgi:hypothetical protein